MRKTFLTVLISSVLVGACGGGGSYTSRDIRFAAVWSEAADIDLVVNPTGGPSCSGFSCAAGSHSGDDTGFGAPPHGEGAGFLTVRSYEPYRVVLRNYESFGVSVLVAAAFGENTSDYKVNQTFFVPAGTQIEVCTYRNGRFSVSRERGHSSSTTAGNYDKVSRLLSR